MTKREHAIALAKKGFPVFKCEINGKRPVVKEPYAVATSDPEKVKEMWTEAVSGDSLHNNIGICTDKLFVLDFDVKDKAVGEAEFNAAQKKYGAHHIVITPSGGYHIYLRMPEGVKVANTTKPTLGKATDSRSWHGYVLGHGSEIDGKQYQWSESEADGDVIPDSINDLAIVPQELIERCGHPREKDVYTLHSLVEWDTSAAISAAIEYLIHRAPVAVQGQGGDNRTFEVAAVVRQYAVSEGVATDLLFDHWNERCEPPWSAEELTKIIRNVYQYAKNAPVVPGSEFDVVNLKVNTPLQAPWPAPTPLEPFEVGDIPEREWIIPGILARTFVTGLVAPSGAGKTQFLLQMILAITTGRAELIGSTTVKPTNVWCWNQEDDMNELKRRLGKSGAMGHFKIEWGDIAQTIAMDSGVNKPLLLVARDEKGRLRETKFVSEMIRAMRERDIGVLIIDPLVEFHHADENNNVEMRIVGAALRRIAVETESAVITGHHTRKPDGAKSDGFAGNADSGRGASSFQGVTRIMLTLYAMSEKDAKEFGVDRFECQKYVRLDGAKANISGPTGDNPLWFERFGYKSDMEREAIGVLVPQTLARSRVKKVEGQMGDVVEPVDTKAAAIAEAMVQLGVTPGTRTAWTPVREKAAEILKCAPNRDGVLGKYPSQIGYGKRLNAGADVEIEFVKQPASGMDNRVIMWVQSEESEDSSPILAPVLGVNSEGEDSEDFMH